MKESTNNTNANNKENPKTRPLSFEEKDVVYIVAKTYQLAMVESDQRLPAACAKLAFDEETGRLNLSEQNKLWLNSVCLQVIKIQYDVVDSLDLISSLLNNYPLYTLHKILELNKLSYIKTCNIESEIARNKILNSEVDFAASGIVDIERLMLVDNYLNEIGEFDRSWENISTEFCYTSKESFLQFSHNSNSIDTACLKLFAMDRYELKEHFGTWNSLWLAVEFLLSDKVSHDYSSLKNIFGISAFYGAKTLIALAEREPKMLSLFFIENEFEQIPWLINALEKNKKLNDLIAEYFSVQSKCNKLLSSI